MLGRKQTGDRRHQMHDMAVALDVAVVVDPDGPWYTDPAEIITPRSTSIRCSARSFSSDNNSFARR